MLHAFVTVVIPFDRAHDKRVEACLTHFGNPPDPNIKGILDRGSFVHFMSMSVVRGDDSAASSHLIMEVSADGTVGSVLEQLASALRPQLDNVLLCAGLTVPPDETLSSFLERHHCKVGQGWAELPGLNFDGTPAMSVAQVRDEGRLAKRIAEIIDTPPRDEPLETPLQTLNRVRDHLWSREHWKWAFFPAPTDILGPRPPDYEDVLKKYTATLQNSLWLMVLGAAAAFFLLWYYTNVWLAALAAVLLMIGLAALPAFTHRDFALARPVFGSLLLNFLWLVVLIDALTFILTWLPNNVTVASKVTFLLIVAEAGLAFVLVKRFQRAEERDKPVDMEPDRESIASFMQREGWCAQSHLAAASTVKPGWLRYLTLRIGLWLAGTLATYFSRPTFLTEIGVIHFARWIFIPGARKIVFLSNYDGAWQSYLEDFIVRTPRGVTMIWSNTEGFPRTKSLILEGAEDGDRLKRWIRRQQYPTLFWYSAYETLTMSRIRRNAEIRNGISQVNSEAGAARWLAAFGMAAKPKPKPAQPAPQPVAEATVVETIVQTTVVADGEVVAQETVVETAVVAEAPLAVAQLVGGDQPAPEPQAPKVGFADYPGGNRASKNVPARALEVDNISTLVFGGLSFLPNGAALLITFADRAGGLEWLAAIQDWVSYGDTRGEHGAVVVGLSSSGIHKLGISAKDLATFPVAFQEGAAAPSRSAVLSDTGPHHPSQWEWGRRGHDVDAVLLLYWDSAQAFKTLRDNTLLPAERLGHDIYGIEFKPPRDKDSGFNEPFGFADGISQPIIREAPRYRRLKDRGENVEDHHLVFAGEFVLGYPNNLGYFPPSPSVSAFSDPHDVLRAVAMDPRPERDADIVPPADARHDLGYNGTYLVVRQLEQDVPAFYNFLERASDEIAAHPRRPGVRRPQLPIWVGPRLVGRWKSGSSLVRNPDRSGLPPRDNDFLFDEDPHGANCPLGAHVRRSNPRDSLEPSDDDARRAAELAVSNRHRVLRVGRPYLLKDGREGLVFMCLNSDIERQFEFIQQNWILGKSFHTLENEIDPILGAAPEPSVFTIPTPSGPLRVKCMGPFLRENQREALVTVRGAGYFFIPGRRAFEYLASLGRVANAAVGLAAAGEEFDRSG